MVDGDALDVLINFDKFSNFTEYLERRPRRTRKVKLGGVPLGDLALVPFAGGLRFLGRTAFRFW